MVIVNFNMRSHNYFVYILTNQNRSVLYIGVTNDLERRLLEHVNHVNNHSFTARYKCHFLIYFEHYQYINDAIEREKEIKGWRRSKKEELISTENKDWEFWNDKILGSF